jgi:hypothetical protein
VRRRAQLGQRWAISLGGCGPAPTDAVPVSTGVPSAFSAQMRVWLWPSAGSCTKARTDSPSTTMVW